MMNLSLQAKQRQELGTQQTIVANHSWGLKLGWLSKPRSGIMEPKYLAEDRGGDYNTPLAHHLTFGESGSLGK